MDSHTTGPGFKIWLIRYFLQSFRPSTTIQYHKVECSLVCVEGRGRISRVGLTQDIKMGSCVFQCDVPHQWIAQRWVGPVSVYCVRGGVSCLVSAAWHSWVAAHWSKYHCYKQAPSRYDLRCLKTMLNQKKKTENFLSLMFQSYVTSQEMCKTN